jgi:hypothetical protein
VDMLQGIECVFDDLVPCFCSDEPPHPMRPVKITEPTTKEPTQ